jgi:hypothetical protein
MTPLCNLQFAKTNSATTVQRLCRTRFGIQFNAFCSGVAIFQNGLPWRRRRRPETLSRINYKQTLRVFLTIVVYRAIVGSLVTSFSHVKVLPSFLIVLYNAHFLYLNFYK